MRRSNFHAVLITPVLALAAGCQDVRTYDDCVLMHMRGVTNNAAAAQIRKSCREKFPEGIELKAKSRDLNPWELAALTGRAGLNYGTRYGGNLYNGNKDITVTEVKISVVSKEDGKDITRVYAADVVIPPLAAKDFAFDIVVGDSGATYNWAIAGGKGY